MTGFLEPKSKKTGYGWGNNLTKNSHAYPLLAAKRGVWTHNPKSRRV